MKSVADFFRKQSRIFIILDLIFFISALFLSLVFRRVFFTAFVLFAFAFFITLMLIVSLSRVIRQRIKNIAWTSYFNTVSFFVLFIGILVVINIIGSKQHFRFDLTRNRLYTLSPQTKEILKNVQEPLEIVFFKSANELNQQISDVLHLYAKLNKNITLKEYDPDISPVEAKKYSVQPLTYGGQTIYSLIYLQYQGKTEKVKGLEISLIPSQTGQFQQSLGIANNLERSVTSAVLRLQSPPKKIYFLQGHGEGDLTAYGKEGYSKLKVYLSQENYDIDFLYLSETKKVPDDCAVLIDLSPKRRYDSSEFQVLNQYLKNKGRLFLLVDPRHHAWINKLVKNWGFVFRNDYVVDKGSPYWYQPVIPFVSSYPIHPIVNKLTSATFFPETSSIFIMNNKTIRSRPLIESSSDSWSDKDFATEDAPVFDKEKDVKGPVVIMAEFENLTNSDGFKIVASGDSDFVANYAVDVYGNLDLFLNTVNFLSERNELNTIRKKQAQQSILSLSQVQLSFIFYFFVILIPIGIVVLGGVFLWKKKQEK